MSVQRAPTGTRAAPVSSPGRGAVLGVLLNHPGDLLRLGDAAHAPPYGAPPRHPVLHVRPRNTWSADGAAVRIPADADEVCVEASLAALMGRSACGVDAAHALEHVHGWLLVADLCIPHTSLYRPALRHRARDGFCVMATEVAPRASIADPQAVDVRVLVDGELKQQGSTAGRVRDPARLIADVSDFMTLQPGDVLMLGPAPDAPRVRAGQAVTVSAPGLASVSLRVVAP